MGTDAPQDPFATQDPFAQGAPAATAEAPAPASAIDPPDEAPAEEIPTVNADGHKINPETGEIIEYAEGYEPPPANDETPVEPEAQPPAPEAPAPAVPEPPAAAPPAPEAPVDPQPENAAQEAPQPPQEPQAAATEAPAPETATDGGDAVEPPAPPAAPATPAEPGDNGGEAAATAEEGKSPWRYYALIYQTGPGQWTEADLANVPDDLKGYVERKAINDKKPGESALFLKARNADHARRLAWIIFERPSGGVTVNAVARSSWQPKRLSPAPPQPERERLSIS